MTFLTQKLLWNWIPKQCPKLLRHPVYLHLFCLLLFLCWWKPQNGPIPNRRNPKQMSTRKGEYENQVFRYCVALCKRKYYRVISVFWTLKLGSSYFHIYFQSNERNLSFSLTLPSIYYILIKILSQNLARKAIAVFWNKDNKTKHPT